MAATGNGQPTHHRPPGERSPDLRQPRTARAHLARFREGTYRLLSQTFLYPDEERVRAVAAAADELWEEGAALAQFAFFLQWRKLLCSVRDLGLRGSPQNRGEYVPMFVVSSTGVACPPYESAYREPAGRPTGYLLAQVEGEYAAAGLTLAPTLGELPDHVAVELEFLALLCGREAEAWEKKIAAGGMMALQMQKTFLDRHLAVWFPEFARQVVAADREGLYAAVSEGAQTFMSYDRDLLSALLEASPMVAETPQTGAQ